ncbi:MAG: PEP-CTERM sorting domain-containing protein, partial [Cyanobacteria bacterium P01_F01_bin.153]
LNNGISGWFEWELDGTSTALKNYHNNYGSWAAYILGDGTYYKKNSSGYYTYQGYDNYWHDTSQYGDGYIKLAKTKGHGDINIDLESTPIPPPPPPVSVPEPTALLGLAAVGFAWRKHKQDSLEGSAIS